MPELPDVESFKRYFKKTSLNKKIIDIECSSKEQIKKINFQNFRQRLIGRSFEDAWRRGKFLIIKIREIPEKLVIHFRMTGNLHYVKQEAPKIGEDRFTRLSFKFANGFELRWLNMRRLGEIYLVRDLNQIKLIREMGPESLELTKQVFFQLLNKHLDKNIKAFLLDQRNIAGIGNVYSDDILFAAKINPHRKIKTISDKERKILYQMMRKILIKAIEHRPPYGKLPSDWFHYHREDMICPRNKNHKLKKEIIAGRSAYFCPICQK